MEWQDYFVVAIAPTHAAYVQVWTYHECAWGRTLINGLLLRQITPDEISPRFHREISLVNQPLAPTHPLYHQWQADSDQSEEQIQPPMVGRFLGTLWKLFH